ncbi:MAG: hypothetical protein ABH851_01690 [Methanobacteriota archaeon]
MKVEASEFFRVVFYVAKIGGLVIGLELTRVLERYVVWLARPFRRLGRTRLEVAGR